MGNACSHMELMSRVFQRLSLSFRSASDKSPAQLQMMHHKLTSLCSVFLRFEDYIIKIWGSKSADVRRGVNNTVGYHSNIIMANL